MDESSKQDRSSAADTPRSPKEIFLASVNRCVANEEFIASFYDRFMSVSDEIRLKFAFTEFKKQNEMLRRSLELCAGATAGEPDALIEIKERSLTHDRHHLDIRPELYDAWFNSMITTAQEYDDRWDEEVESTWRRILGYIVKRMVRSY